MEFKGTKGNWVANYNNGSWLIQDKEAYRDGFKGAIAEVYYFDDGEDTAEYNALIISKAPEMLEELIKEVEILKSIGLGDTERCKRKEKLIKQATEI